MPLSLLMITGLNLRIRICRSNCPACALERICAGQSHADSTVTLQDQLKLSGIVPCMLVSSYSVALGPVAAVRSGSHVRGRLARSGEIWGVGTWFGRGLPDLWLKGGATVAIGITDDTMTLVDRELRVVPTARLAKHAAAPEDG